MLDNLRRKFESFNLNTFLASVVSTIASLSADDWMQIFYFIIAVIAQILTIYSAFHKTKAERAITYLEVEMKKEELRGKRITNDLKLIRDEKPTRP